MRKYLFWIWIVATLTMGVSSCSDDDDIFNVDVEQTSFNTKLLPGYWVCIDEDGKEQNWGWWISNEPSTMSGSAKVAKMWQRQSPKEKGVWSEETFWWTDQDGYIHIWMWEGDRVITHLTKKRMRIMSWWLQSDPAYAIYKRMDSAPNIEEKK